MIYVDNNNVINLNKGDDAVLTVQLLNTDGTPFTIGQSEYLIFGLREKPSPDSTMLLTIESSLGSNLIEFTHNDTKDMEVGFYSAEIQLMTEDEQRVTVWPKLVGNSRTSKSNRKNFCLMTEVVTT